MCRWKEALAADGPRKDAGLKTSHYKCRRRGREARFGWERLRDLRTLAGRILRIAALPARWQARHMYQLATVR